MCYPMLNPPLTVDRALFPRMAQACSLGLGVGVGVVVGLGVVLAAAVRVVLVVVCLPTVLTPCTVLTPWTVLVLCLVRVVVLRVLAAGLIFTTAASLRAGVCCWILYAVYFRVLS